MVSRDPSTEMSSGGSQPLAKRQSVHEAPALFEGLDVDKEGGLSWADLLGGSELINEQAGGMDGSATSEGAAAAVATAVVEAAAGLLGLAQVEGSLMQRELARNAAATVVATPTTDETTRTLSRTAPGVLHEQQVDRPASAIAAAGDSSDEEGAHKPPPPPPEPAPPPAPPLTQPGPQLAQQIARLVAALPPAPPPHSASTQQPRTTRITADLKPKGHKQSFASAEERMDLKAKSQQQRRKREQAHRAMYATVSRMLDSPDVSVDDVLMIEFAVQPENQQTEPGAMRAAYLQLLHVDEKDRRKLRGARMKEHVPRQLGVGGIHTVQDVLLENAELREKAAKVIRRYKLLYCSFLSGMPPFEKVRTTADETLMALMTRTRLQLQPVLGRRPKSEGGIGCGVRQSRAGGQVTLDWREREHRLRTYAANKPISYRAVAEVAKLGALLHIEGVAENDLSQSTSRSAATMHDEQNHLIQRRCAREVMGHSPLILQWDEGSKRKKAWVVAILTGLRERGDLSRLREVQIEKCTNACKGPHIHTLAPSHA